ncbi:MAG: diacylglycerol kinase family lipid kinase [Clostridia bacterium]|nr:diacylglycerol kinase family lipid kinase [Clostridia bacterium]
MIYAVCNPTAGAGRGEKIGRQIEQALRERNLPCRLMLTEHPGHAAQLAREAREAGAELILSIGGDGTAFEVAQGLLGSACPLGIIPAGTGNDFVKTIGIPQQPLAALDHVLSCPARPTDAGQINGRMFLNEIGTGFDVSVLDYALKAKKYCRGLLPYLYGVVKTLFRFRSVSITYTVDSGETVTRDVFVVGVANGGVIGGGIVIAPEARADDGLLDVVVVEKVARRHLPARLIGLMRGRILSFPETHFCRAHSISFSTPGMRVNVDGEILDEKRVEARVLPGALMIRR